MKEATNGSLGSGDELTGSADLAKTAVDDHADALGQGGCVLEVVGDEEDGDAEPSEEVVELRPDIGLGVGVECGERLVEQQHVRVARERARERDPLAFSAGEIRWPGSFQMPDREPVEVLVGRVALRVFDVLADGQMREEGVVLEDETDTAPVRGERDSLAPSNQGSPSDVIRPEAGLTSPAIALRTVVFPAPDGPTRAIVESTSRLSRRLKARRGTTISSRVSVAMSVRF